jgi:hypothetical protein
MYDQPRMDFLRPAAPVEIKHSDVVAGVGLQKCCYWVLRIHRNGRTLICRVNLCVRSGMIRVLRGDYKLWSEIIDQMLCT